MNRLLTIINNVTVTLQWPREIGGVYQINVLPETPLDFLNNNVMTVTINLILSYDIEYNVSSVSNLCGVTEFNQGVKLCGKH